MPRRVSPARVVRKSVRSALHLQPGQWQYIREQPLDFLTETAQTRLALADERRLLQQSRDGHDVCWLASDEPEPLVTVRIATYNRGKLVAERALASALRQTYRRLEILVVGDRCDEATEAAVRSVKDPRVRFINLAERGLYPLDPKRRWMVAGTAPMNAALAVAQGKWIAPCDDDDELTDDHVEVLLSQARRRHLELVWSKSAMELEVGKWITVGSEALKYSEVTHGSVMYAGGLRFFRHSDRSWKLGEPGDWNLWRRMKAAGVKMGFVDHVTYSHYAETFRRS